MGFVKITLSYQYVGQLCQNTFDYWNNGLIPSLANVDGLLDEFEATILPGIQNAQVNGVSYSSLSGFAPNIGFSVVRALSGTGNLAVLPAASLPPDIALVIDRRVGLTVQNVTGAAYTGNRPIKRGRFYLSGLPKDLIDSSGYNQGSTYDTNIAAMLAPMDDPLTGTDFVVWTPVVYGAALAALPPSPSYPTGKAMRPEVVAPVESFSVRTYTNLSSRDL